MFDFSHHMELLCRDIVARVPVLGHIDMDRVPVAIAQARKRSRHGRQATLTPLRFEGGQTTAVRAGRRVGIRPLMLDGREMLYIVTFYLPRFLNQPRDQKLRTTVHELYHISERFDGDLRRPGGGRYAHTRRRRHYDEIVDGLVSDYLGRDPDHRRLAFLDSTFSDLRDRHGDVFGRRIPRPRLIPA